MEIEFLTAWQSFKNKLLNKNSDSNINQRNKIYHCPQLYICLSTWKLFKLEMNNAPGSDNRNCGLIKKYG